MKTILITFTVLFFYASTVLAQGFDVKASGEH
jgi:hypothetical protein